MNALDQRKSLLVLTESPALAVGLRTLLGPLIGHFRFQEPGEKSSPQVVLAEVSESLLPENIVTVHRRHPGAAVIALGPPNPTAGVFHGCLRAGARGFVVRSANADELAEAVERVAAGGTYFSPCVRDYLDIKVPRNQPTRREREILRHAAAGLTDKQIAARLGLAPSTVNTHFKRLFGKLRVHTRLEAFRATGHLSGAIG